MGSGVLIAIGAACGLVGCLPPASLLAKVLKGYARVQVAQGIVSILVSFGFMSAVLVVVRMVQRDGVLLFGAAMLVAFLLTWGVWALRIWLGARTGRDSEGRN